MRSSLTRSKAKGFTIIEILVATSIFAVIMIAALLMYDRSNKVFKSGVEAADVQQNTRIAFDKIVADLRMAGFDFDRDGIPSLENAYQQPDEQIEYISQAAITVRANYDYNDDPVNTDHGREFEVGSTPGASGLESTNFPVVTTGNDEIVTYALVSADSTKNTDSITFFADVPDRKSHPETGGRSEASVTITGIDLSNANPPYTLERISLNPSSSSVTPLIRYPIATNMRSMTFEYFEDQVGMDPLTDLSGNVIAPANYVSVVGGLGQFDPDATSVEVERQLRAKIQSIKVVLTGMTENPDFNYTDPNDTVAPRYRKYRLESLIVPRNYGRRGFKEQDYVEPQAPVITQVCIGYCGVAYVRWDQPVTGGAPEDYQIRVDTDPAGSYPIREAVGLKTFDFVKLPDPSAQYFFIVAAINSYGSAASVRYPAGGTGLSAQNNTKPGLADSPLATAQTNQIRLDWTVPSELTDLDGSSAQPACYPGGTPPDDLPIEEFDEGGFRIARSRASGFAPVATDVIFDPQTPTGQTVTIDPITFGAFYTDKSTVTRTGPAACYDYFYRLRTQEACFTAATNNGGDPEKARSAAWTTEVTTRFTSSTQPLGPTTLEVIEADSSCDIDLTGYCTVKLKWEKVKKDVTSTADQYITIGQYLVYRDTYEMDGTLRGSTVLNARYEELDAWLGSGTYPEIDFSDPAYITFVDRSAPSRQDPSESAPVTSLGAPNDPVYNEYRVVAKQCLGDAAESPDSDPSPTVKYPCAFAPNLVGATMSGTIEGSGTIVSPWLIQPTSELAIIYDVPVASMEASILMPDSSRVPLPTASGFPGTTGVFPWDAGLPDGAAYQIDVLVTTTSGCKRTLSYWVQSTATNCCLTPVDVEVRLLQQDGPGQKTRIRLQNRCSQSLTLQQVRILWDANNFLSAAGAERLLEVRYPPSASPLGACPSVAQVFGNPANTALQITSTPPGGARVTIPTGSSSAGIVCGNTGSDDYEVEVFFNKSYDPLNPPITQVCITYIRGTDPSTSCQILPGASNDQAVCDSPTNANLINLALSQGTLTPTFAPGTTSYAATVHSSVSSITVTPTTEVNGTTVTVNGVEVPSGSASAPISLATGPNVITVRVTALDGTTTKTYTVTVRRQSSDATLRALSLSSGTLSPAFASNTLNYTATVINSTSSITVTPTKNHPNATIRVNGTPVTSGTPSAPISLSPGANLISITVTAEDGTTIRTYTVTVTRTPSANADLSGLTTSVGVLTPAFLNSTTSYTVAAGGATSIKLTPVSAHPGATIRVNGALVESGNETNAIPLAVGSNTITIVVTAQDGVTTKTYTVTVTRSF